MNPSPRATEENERLMSVLRTKEIVNVCNKRLEDIPAITVLQIIATQKHD